jgi:hypothetical protein
MQLELKSELESRAAARAKTAGLTVAEFLENLIERNLPEESSASQTTLSAKAKDKLTPTQLSFSLWLRGFVNAALTINIILSLSCVAGALVTVLFRDQVPSRLLSGIVTLSFAVATFSPLSAGAIALLAGLRHLYTRFSAIVVITAVAGSAAYVILGTLLISLVQRQDWKAQAGILAAFVLAFVTGVIAFLGIRFSDMEKFNEVEPRQKLTVRDFLSWRWYPNMDEDVKEIYNISKGLKPDQTGSPQVARQSLPIDIGSDFKAWNDVAKLLITIATGLTVISALFSGGNNVLEQAIRLIALLFLLVPGLSCAYMEAFKRQCERQWQMLGINQEGS